VPLDDKSVYARFVAEKGEGVHHIALATPSFDETVAAQAERGNGVVLSGEFSGVRSRTSPPTGISAARLSPKNEPGATPPWRS
jgi:hypothetical protein